MKPATQAIEVKCILCNTKHVVIVATSDYRRWASGQAHIQDAMPYLSDDERELLISGICPHCWDKL